MDKNTEPYERILILACVYVTCMTALPVGSAVAGLLPVWLAWVHVALLAGLWGVSLWSIGEIGRMTGEKA